MRHKTPIIDLTALSREAQISEMFYRTFTRLFEADVTPVRVRFQCGRGVQREVHEMRQRASIFFLAG